MVAWQSATVLLSNLLETYVSVTPYSIDDVAFDEVGVVADVVGIAFEESRGVGSDVLSETLGGFGVQAFDQGLDVAGYFLVSGLVLDHGCLFFCLNVNLNLAYAKLLINQNGIEV